MTFKMVLSMKCGKLFPQEACVVETLGSQVKHTKCAHENESDAIRETQTRQCVNSRLKATQKTLASKIMAHCSQMWGVCQLPER